MKRIKISFLIVVVLLTSLMASCIPGQGQPASGWSGTTFHEGIVYVGTGDGRVVAISATTRELLWSHAFEVRAGGGLGCGPSSVPDAIYTTPIVDGDLVYIGTFSGKVVALNTTARSQELRFPQARHSEWEWDCPAEDAVSNSIVANLLVTEDAVYASSSNGRVYSLDKESGDENWTREGIPNLGQKLWTSPAISGDILYVSTFDGHIYVLSAETGGMLDWSFELEAGFASSPVIYGDTMYVGSFDNNLYAIRIGDSEPLWAFSGRKWFWAAPLVHDGVVYAGSLDGRLYLVDAETGEKIGEFDAGSPIVSSPVIMDDLLIVVDQSGDVYAFDLSSALQDREVPLMRIELGVRVESPFGASDGLAYIRGEGKLYVVDVEKGWVTWELSLTAEE